MSDLDRVVATTVPRYVLCESQNYPDALLVSKLPKVALSDLDGALGCNHEIFFSIFPEYARDPASVDISLIRGLCFAVSE